MARLISVLLVIRVVNHQHEYYHMEFPYFYWQDVVYATVMILELQISGL